MPGQEIDDILQQANKEATPKAMADGVTYKQATTLDNGGYHAFQAFNPATNRDTSAIKVQEMFREQDMWKASKDYPFGDDSAPVSGEINAQPPALGLPAYDIALNRYQRPMHATPPACA